MTTATKKPAGWTDVRKALASKEKPALIALIKDLYDTAEVNRDLLQPRLLGGENEGEFLRKYRHRIVEQFFPARGFGKLKLGEARQAVRDYRKATGNVSGAAELLLTYVENGTKFTSEFGDIDERFYSSIESALQELAALLRGEARALYPQFAERLAGVAALSDGTGWGFHDFVSAAIGNLADELAGAWVKRPPLLCTATRSGRQSRRL